MSNQASVKTLGKECFGIVTTTPSIAAFLPAENLSELLDRHFQNDWGDLCAEDAELNAEAVNECEGRIMSSYVLSEVDEKVWIITYLQSDPKLQQDMNYCNTTVMFSSEY